MARVDRRSAGGAVLSSQALEQAKRGPSVHFLTEVAPAGGPSFYIISVQLAYPSVT